jgi:hypothetical protein
LGHRPIPLKDVDTPLQQDGEHQHRQGH